MNARWHAAHVMPKPATDAQRVAWHVQHAKHCGCREIPAGVRRLMTEARPAAKKRRATRA